MKNLDHAQDNVLKQLTDIESVLDSFLELQVDSTQNNMNQNMSNNYHNSNNQNRSNEGNYDNTLFKLQSQINGQINTIQSSLNDLDDKVKILYTDQDQLKDKINNLKNDKETESITIILNDFYHSLQSLKYYQVSFLMIF